MFEIKPETTLDIYLPWPPSINHYYGHRALGKRVMQYIGAKGKKYREEVRQSLTRAMLEHCKKHFTSDTRLKIDAMVLSPDKRRRDIDNLLKASIDALMHAGVFPDDSQIDDIHIVRYIEHIQKPGGLMVRISVIESKAKE